jgi:DNA polymerase V
MKAMDGLNASCGRDTLAFAAAGRGKAWKLRRDFMSPRYTTSWNELLAV